MILRYIQQGLVTEASELSKPVLASLLENKLVGVVGGKLYLKESGFELLAKYAEKVNLISAIEQKVAELMQAKDDICAELEAEMTQKTAEPTVVSFQATLQPEVQEPDYLNQDLVCPNCLYKGPMQVSEAFTATTPSSTTQPTNPALQPQQQQQASKVNPMIKNILDNKYDNSKLPPQAITALMRNKSLVPVQDPKNPSKVVLGVSPQVLKALEQEQQATLDAAKEAQKSIQQSAAQAKPGMGNVIEGVEFGKKINAGVRNYKKILEHWENLK